MPTSKQSKEKRVRPILWKRMIFNHKKVMMVFVLSTLVNIGHAAEYRHRAIPILAKIVNKAIDYKCVDNCWEQGFMSVSADTGDLYVVVYGVNRLRVARQIINDIFEVIKNERIRSKINLHIYKSHKKEHGFFGIGSVLLIKFIYEGEV